MDVLEGQEIPMTPLEPVMCECHLCEECRQHELQPLYDLECTCVYEDIPHTDEEGNEYTVRELVTKCDRCIAIDGVNKKYDGYIMMEKANIDKSVWKDCKIIDGVIYTPVLDGEKSVIEKLTDSNDVLTSRMEIAENALLELMIQQMENM